MGFSDEEHVAPWSSKGPQGPYQVACLQVAQ